MRILWIGYGQAGGKIANTLMGINRKLYEAIAINTEQADLGGLSHIREKVLIGRYALKGRRVGANIELGANSSGPHHQDSGEAKIRESTAGVSRKPSSDGKVRGSSSKHLCGLTAWNT